MNIPNQVPITRGMLQQIIPSRTIGGVLGQRFGTQVGNQIQRNVGNFVDPQAGLNSPMAQDYGWLGNVLMDATSPFRTMLEGANQIIQANNQANDQDARDYANWLKRGNTGTLAGYMQIMKSPRRAGIQPVFLDQTELNRTINDPVRTGFGETVKGATYFLSPVSAATVPNALLRSAATGSLNGALWNLGNGIQAGGPIGDNVGYGALYGMLGGVGGRLASNALGNLSNSAMSRYGGNTINAAYRNLMSTPVAGQHFTIRRS